MIKAIFVLSGLAMILALVPGLFVYPAAIIWLFAVVVA